MQITDSGALICTCLNQELVLIACLPPWQDTFMVLCRKCGEKAGMYLSHDEHPTYKVVTFPPKPRPDGG